MAEKTNGTVVNREYKSDVFSMLMEIPENALQVYNALNGTSHSDPAQLEMKRLDKGRKSLHVRKHIPFFRKKNL